MSWKEKDLTIEKAIDRIREERGLTPADIGVKISKDDWQSLVRGFVENLPANKC